MKIKKILILLLLVMCTCACSNNKTLNKTEFNINEDVRLDDISIKLTKASWTETSLLEFVFEIKNNKKDTISINAEKNFKIYDARNNQLINNYNNNKSIIKNNETIYYTLHYNILDKDKKIYEILFYSGVVENNIKFIINKENIIKEGV